MAERAVVLANVVKRFGKVEAVCGVSLEIDHGEFVVLMGPSGCGKTTTLRLIAGLDVPTEGDVYINGERVNERKPWERDTPLVWQSFALFPFLTVAGNVEFGLKMRKLPRTARREKVRQVLDMVGIGHLGDRPISQISGGEKQRVGLARAIVTEPSVLLLDEPLAALDAHLRVRMQAELRNLHERLGLTFIYVTHDQSEALSMGDRIVLMDNGRVQQIGTPQEIYRAPQNHFVADFVGANNILSGVVTAVTNNQVSVKTRAGTFTVVGRDGQHLPIGAKASFVICADRVATEFESGARDNNLVGTLRGQEFVGAVVTFFLELEDGSEFRIQKQESQSAKIRTKLGAKLAASWDSREAFLLPTAQEMQAQ
jgi:spermidine/putrescine transport system ATP-binding protein